MTRTLIVPDPPTSRSQMANFMTFSTTAKTQISGNDIVIGTDRLVERDWCHRGPRHPPDERAEL